MLRFDLYTLGFQQADLVGDSARAGLEAGDYTETSSE